MQSLERLTAFDRHAQLVYYIILVPVLFLLIYYPLAGMPLIALWTMAYGVILLFRRKRKQTILSHMKRIAELSGAVAMIVRNNESHLR